MQTYIPRFTSYKYIRHIPNFRPKLSESAEPTPATLQAFLCLHYSENTELFAEQSQWEQALFDRSCADLDLH